MIIAFFVFLVVGVIVAAAPGVLVGYAFVAVSGGLSRGVRLTLLLLLAAASAAMWWVVLMGEGEVLGPAAATVSCVATVSSGATFLGREANRLRGPARLHTQPWPDWNPPVDPHGGR
ncbi:MULTISPECIES: hypothetical protein [unclassified Streptomyces]|uniref:hypothetical protein n=1 Tax=Streptomyces sp. TN58 TaxID=234612 RepID=UPI0004AB2C2F|nr:hypothetical protein [Streptomyces sp. TN58]APU38622.1 hypothetical protein BSL84_01380 [Streptomyces sp. TN58]